MADYDIGAAFEQIEDELISSMTRNLKRHTVEEITEGYEWAQWQVLQLQALEDYKRRARAKYGTTFSSINDKIEKSITDSYTTAQTEQEKEILRQIRNDLPEPAVTVQGIGSFTGEFFKTNDRKLDALIKATTDDMQRAETAVLRMTNDKYRSIIFNAQVYANTGAGTYAKAVDMATKDFLSAGINCIEYKNGRRVNIRSYAEMALRTANKRAYLQGEGEMRKKWGIHTVILNKRTNACPKCTPFVGKVIVDDVWSGGTAEEATKSGYLLMSECISQGLYHPNCRDSHTTYFGDILDEDEDEEDTQEEQTFTPEEQTLNEQLYEAEQRGNYCERQIQRFERLSEYSLDEGNIKEYRARKRDWTEKLTQSRETAGRIKEQITLNEEKQLHKRPKHKGKKPSAVGAMIARDVMSDAVQRLSFDVENPRENEEKTVANSAESGIIEERLTEDEMRALNAYISSDSYKINRKLRTGAKLTDYERSVVENLDSALQKMPKYEGTVYRSLDSNVMENPEEFFVSHQPGTIVQSSAYMSTSTSVYDDTMDIQCVIKSKNGRNIFLYNKAEKEILFERDTNLIVTKIRGNIIYMEEV